MHTQNIAIIGSGSTGEMFLTKMLQLKPRGVNVVGVYNREGLELNSIAEETGIKRLSLQEMVDLGEELDIIFDLSGKPEIRSELRKTLFSSNNLHTVIAPESVAQVIWTLMDEQGAPLAKRSYGG